MSAAPRSTPNRQTNLPQQACRNLSPSSRVNTVLYHSAHRRNSDGNYTTPTQIILRVPHPPSPIMEVCHRATRSQSLRTQETVYCRRSLSPTRVDLGSVTRGFDDEGSLSLQSGSGSSTPTSTMSRSSSIDSCSELVAALEAMALDLQQESEAANRAAASNVTASQGDEAPGSNGEAGEEISLVDNCIPEEAQEEEKKEKVTKNLALAEKEKYLTECKNQIKSLSQSKQLLEKRVEELQSELEITAPFRTASKKGSAKRWPKFRTMTTDLGNKLAYDDVYVEATEIINAFLESERNYLNVLDTLHNHYELPLKMLSSFKPEVLSIQQLHSLFLNCAELVLIHRCLYEDLSHLPSLPESVQVDKLLEILERTFCSFSLYNSFLDNTRPQTVQKELRQLSQKQEFVQLLDHCKATCNGVGLSQLLQLPAERLTQYSDLLTHFLDPHVRGLPEDGSKRAEALIRFLRNLRYDLLDDKSEWDHTLEKIKLLHKLAPGGSVPLEVFDSNVYLMKQGPLNQVVGSKEIPRYCFLFNKFIAVGEKASDTQFKIIENGMTPLSGAQLHKCVDIEGQAIGSDLQSGLKEDRLAFCVSFHNNESLFMRAAKPNVWKSWTEALEKSIHECQVSQHVPEPEHFGPLFSDVGTKIAAASLEKLFQQLTSPHMFRDDFMEVFLMTHRCFTTPKDVLTALLNCLKSPEDTWPDSSSQGSSNALFPFSMDELTEGSSCMSASSSQYAITTDSDGSPRSGPSPSHFHRSKSSPSSVAHCTTLDPPTLTDRKSVHSGSSFLSNSDSDTSPHTSAIVIDNPQAGRMHTQDGWLDPEMGLKGVKLISQAQNDQSNKDDLAEDNPYTKLLPRARVHLPSDLSGDESEDECDGGLTPLQSSLTGSLDMGHSYTPRSSRQRSLTDGGDSALVDKLNTIGHSSQIAKDLEDATKMMDAMIGSLDTDFDVCRRSSHSTDDVFQNETSDVQYRQRLSHSQANRLSLSTSESDLTLIGTPETPPPLLPRDTPTHTAFPLSPGKHIRHNSEHKLIVESLSNSRSEPSSPFHLGKSINGPKSPRTRNSLSASPGRPGKGKSQTIERTTRLPRFSKKSSKKCETMDGRYTSSKGIGPSISVTSSLNALSIQGLQNGLGESVPDTTGKSPKRSKWDGLRKKIGIGKKFGRSPSMEAEELRSLQDRGAKGPVSFPRKGSLIGDALLSISGGANMTDGGVATRRRRSSTCHGNSVALVSKIFAVLECWLLHFFEDFEHDVELKKTLCDFLQTLAHKTGTESFECQFASQLLETIDQDMATPPTNTFPMLLSKTINVDPAVLMLYDWDHPDKLIPETTIDLSKVQPKDSQLLKVIAEQITLMEFAVYAAVQRRELLNCNWKKPNKDKLAPNVCRLIRRTNEMTSWVSTEILSRVTPSQRAAVIENFIKIATYCYKHNDMHCALNITIALGSACIKCLRHTWEEVDKRYRLKFEKLKDWTDYHGRCKKMREKLERITAESLQKNEQLPTALPYIGAYLDQIYTLEMSSKTYNPNGLVNFAKMTKLSSIVHTALQYQREKFKFEHRVDLMVYVTAAKRLSENDLFELSMKREPSSH